MRNLLLSVIVCTRNRAGELSNCLPELARQAGGFDDVEVVVVDNASTDDTRERVAALSRECGFAFRYVYAAEPGLCRARNRGRAAAGGRVIAYIDDDEVVRPGWVSRAREHFIAAKSDCLAGKIGVKAEGELPRGLTPDMMWILGATDFGDEPRFMEPHEYPQGGNFAVRTEVFDAVGGFDTNIKLYGDETEFFQRARKHDFVTFYDPDFAVDQYVPAARLTNAALKHKAYQWGRGAAMSWMLSSPGAAGRWAKAGEYVLRTAYVGLRWCAGPRFGRYFTFWHNCGYARQLIRGVR